MNTELAANGRIREAMHSSTLHRLVLLLVLVSAFVAYSGALGYEFVYDDDDQIVRNRYLTSWSYLPRYFTEHLWSHRDFNSPGIYYRPLFLVWLRINRSLLGVSSTLWHLMAIITFLASVVMVYWMAKRLLNDRVTAVFAAMVFGLYPLHIETTAWVSGVTEPLLALLVIPAFLLYLKARADEHRGDKDRLAEKKWLVASLGLFAAGLLAKETAIVLPAIIFAYELICGSDRGTDDSGVKPQEFQRTLVRALKSIVPYIAVSLIYLIIRGIVLGEVAPTLARLSFMTKVLTVPSLLWSYLKLLFWPVGLSEFYNVPYVTRPGLASFFLPLAGVALAVSILWWAIRRIRDIREKRIVTFACAWTLIPLLPVLNISSFRPGDLIHDRYLFLPTIGFSLLVGYGLRKINMGEARMAGLPQLQVLSAIVLAGALGLATAFQHVHWANNIVLFHHSLSVAPGNEIAQDAFGDALSKREMYDEAIIVLEELVRNHPENATGRYNLGYNYYKVGRYKEAVSHLAAAVSMDPRNERWFLTLGVTLFYLDKYDVAEQALREGIKLRSDGLGLHYALGAVFKETGRLEEALTEFNQELAYNPDYVSAYDQIDQVEKLLQTGPQSQMK